MSSTVVIVDDHELIRMSIGAALSATGEIEVTGECVDGSDAVQAARELKPDVVLMDISMPVLDGLSATRQILDEQPAARVVIMTAATGQDQLEAAMASGAVSFVHKGEGIDVVVNAVLAAAGASQG